MQNTIDKIVGAIMLVAFLALLYGMLVRASHLDAHLNRVSECVAAEAQHQGFHGNPYGEDAWNTFAPGCNE